MIEFELWQLILLLGFAMFDGAISYHILMGDKLRG